MEVEKLEIAQCRVFNQVTFDFKSGMNLIVGVNGAGKSTVIDILRRMFSYSLPSYTAARIKPISFTEDDIKFGRDSMTLQLAFEVSEITIDHLIHFPRESMGRSDRQFVDDLQTAVHVDRRRRIELRRKRVDTEDVVDLNDLFPRQPLPKNIKRLSQQPLVIFFSTYRSVPNERDPGDSVSAGGQTAAFGDALTNRQLNIGEFARWWFAQQTLAAEGLEKSQRRLEVFSQTVSQFLEGYTNLRAVVEPKPTLLVDKGNETINVRMLSDGERSLLALILDMTRRLTQANPELDNPIEDGQAVVLIDELDMHLHPGWQRTIVERLLATFPKCQFICTTHSPLIIGETQPSSLFLLTKQGNEVKVKSKSYSYGLDANSILETLMDTPNRPPLVQDQINRVEDELEAGELDRARKELDRLREMMHGDVNEVIRLEASINTLEALANEVDSEE